MCGRLATLSAQGLPNLPGKAHAFEYTYEPGSSLIDKLTPDPVGAGGPVHEVDNDYEQNRNVLLQKKNTRTVGTPGEISVIGYTVNELGQRVQRNLSGEIRAEFYGGQAEDIYPTGWTYDALGQVTSKDKPATASDRGYSYDQIGNRLTSTVDTETTAYSSNALNQYSEINNLQSAIHNPVHDAEGNMTTGLLNGSTTGQFGYDGANQLIRTQATATSDPTRYTYDAFGRRIAKVTYNTSNEPTAATLFLYDGWNLIAEYKLDAGTWILDRTYTWGIDLSSTLQGAGGVSGLLSVTKHEAQSTSNFFPIYDGNGNIEAYLDSNGDPAVIYQYDAFGNVLSGNGKGVAIEQAKFSHRFSTKYQDAETGLLYYGYRYYHAMLGCWVNKDPIEERGGLNLYGFVGNAAVDLWDYLGREWESNLDYFYRTHTGPVTQAQLEMFPPHVHEELIKKYRLEEQSGYNGDIFVNYLWKENSDRVTLGFCGCDISKVKEDMKEALRTFKWLVYPGIYIDATGLGRKGTGVVTFMPELTFLPMIAPLGGVYWWHKVTAFGSMGAIDQRVITNPGHVLVGIRMWGHSVNETEFPGHYTLTAWTMAQETWNNAGGFVGGEFAINATAKKMWIAYLERTTTEVLKANKCQRTSAEIKKESNYPGVVDMSPLPAAWLDEVDWKNPFLNFIPEVRQ